MLTLFIVIALGIFFALAGILRVDSKVTVRKFTKTYPSNLNIYLNLVVLCVKFLRVKLDKTGLVYPFFGLKFSFLAKKSAKRLKTFHQFIQNLYICDINSHYSIYQSTLKK